MKKLTLFYLCLLGLMFNQTNHAQCVPNCSVYAVTPIAYNTFPTGNPIPTTSFAPNSDDGITPLIPIGFSFNFYCTTYNDLRICNNGFLQFNDGFPAVSTGYVDPAQVFPNPTAPNTIIALNMTDLDLTLAGSISYTTIGVSPNQIFVLTFSNVPLYGDLTSPTTGQILLYETSNLIEIYTATVTNNSTPSSVQGIQYGTQGIESQGGTLGAAVPGRNQAVWSATNTAYQFSPFAPTPPSSVSGPTLLCSGDMVTYNIPPSSGALSYNWFTNASWTGTSTSTTYTGIIGSSSTLSVSVNYTCGASQPLTLSVTAIQAPTVSYVAVYPSTVCSANNNVLITVSGAQDYTLDPGGLITSAGSPFTVTPITTTEYTLTGTNATGCLSYNQPVTTVSVNPTPIITVNSGSICAGQGFTMEPSGGVNYTYTGSSNSPYVNPSPGVYNYTVNSTVDGCVGIPAICSLTVYSMPTTNAIATKTNVCKSDRITVFANGAQNYLWNTSATTSVTTLNFSSYSGLTTFSVIGTNEGGCAKTATLQFNVSNCTGIEEQGTNTNNLIVYPNPNKGEFTVEMTNDGLEKHIALTDLVGRTVITHKTSNHKIDININELNSGIYFLQVQSGNEKHTIKVVKE